MSGTNNARDLLINLAHWGGRRKFWLKDSLYVKSETNMSQVNSMSWHHNWVTDLKCWPILFHNTHICIMNGNLTGIFISWHSVLKWLYSASSVLCIIPTNFIFFAIVFLTADKILYNKFTDILNNLYYVYLFK